MTLVPGKADTYYRRGLSYYYLGDPNRAMQDYNKAVEINPNHAEAYYNRGVIHGKLGNKVKEMEDYNKASELNQRTKADKPMEVLHKDNEKTKGMAESKKRLDDLARENEKLRKELTAVTSVKKQEPVLDHNKTVRELSAIDWFKKGYASSVSGNYQEAIDSYDKAIELNPNLADAYYVRGNARHSLGDPDRAIQDFDKTIELSPEYASAYYGRGLAYDKLSNPKQSVENYKKAARLGFKAAQDVLKGKGIAW